MTCANVLVGGVKDCKGGGLGRGWAGGWWCGYRHRSAKGATSPFGDRFPPNGISIHAPRRERLKSHPRLQEKYGFQSTLPRRERRACLVCLDVDVAFQSTLPRRERLWMLMLRTRDLVFQSTLPRRERRKVPPCPVAPARISIHAPAKGATRRIAAIAEDTMISIHAPAKGATVYNGTVDFTQAFQSTLPRRERHCGYSSSGKM